MIGRDIKLNIQVLDVNTWLLESRYALLYDQLDKMGGHINIKQKIYSDNRWDYGHKQFSADDTFVVYGFTPKFSK